MIYICPRCNKKNRLPDTLQMDGEYRCGSCRQLLIGVSAKGEPKKSRAGQVRPSSAGPSAPSPRPAASGWSAALQKKYPQYLYLTRFLRWSDAVGAQVRAVRQQSVQRRGAAGKPVWKQAFQAKNLAQAWKKMPTALRWANGAYLLALLALAISDAAGPELSWLGSFNLYMPQWIWALPGGLLLLLTLIYAHVWAWVPALALLWVFGPVMGFCGNGLFPAGTAGTARASLRVMTYNVKGGSRDDHAVAADVLAFHPDLLQMQDSGGVLQGELGKVLATWNVRVSGQYIVASPHPLPELESRDISFAGSNHHCVRYVVQMGAVPVTVYDVHLLSPRDGLVSVRHHQIGAMEWNADARLREADRLAGYVRQEPGPTLLTGDLNAPVQALVCRKLFGAGLRDAFSEAGLGYGYTYGRYTKVGHPYVRIDHILASRQWRIQKCWVGNAQGSDHCPVIADLLLP